MAVAAPVRFLRFYKIELEDDRCWEWRGGFFKHAEYGKFNAGSGRADNRTVYAHRFAMELKHGSIPKGMSVLHRCDNPRCVRPDHLFFGTQQDNVDDMIKKDRGFWQRKSK